MACYRFSTFGAGCLNIMGRIYFVSINGLAFSYTLGEDLLNAVYDPSSQKKVRVRSSMYIKDMETSILTHHV